MHLTTLDVANVRNLASVQLEPGDGINYLYGDNGAGKTSLLEAISLLSVGRSFRSGKISTIIASLLAIMSSSKADPVYVGILWISYCFT